MSAIPQTGPDDRGRYGSYGGRFVPETLMGPLQELEDAYRKMAQDSDFQQELNTLLRFYVGRPTPLTPTLNERT
jgi:tryptophan synthase beta chain